jgi:hypothetical protein
MVDTYNGVPEVSHTGSTGGYRAFLARYPQQDLSVALLCNIGNVNPGQVGHQIADVFLGNAVRRVQAEPPKAVSLPAEQLATKAGIYRESESGEPLRLVFVDGALRMQAGGALVPVSPTVFRVGAGQRRLTFEPAANGGRPRIRATNGDAPATLYEPVPDFAPTTADLAAYTGEFYSPDAETALVISVENGRLIGKRRPDTRIEFTPVYPDAFQASSLGFVRFLRDGTGRVMQLSVRQARVYDLRFERVQR